MRITEKSLRKMIKSALNEFDNPKQSFTSKTDNIYTNKIDDYYEDDIHKENKGSRTTYKRMFTVSPENGIKYFKDILSQDHGNFMNFLHVFLDFMLNLNDAINNDRENFKISYQQMMPVFVQFLRHHNSQGHAVDKKLMKDLSEFFIFFGRRLSTVNLTDFVEDENEENSDVYYESRIHRRRR